MSLKFVDIEVYKVGLVTPEKWWLWERLPGFEARRGAMADVPIARKGFGGRGPFATIVSVTADDRKRMQFYVEAARFGITWWAHPAVVGDQIRAARVKARGDKPCKRCDGTGNELRGMYKQCGRCGGSGKEPKQ